MEDMWTPYKELVSVVEGYLAHEGGSAPYAVHTFESVLRRHKQTFLCLLKNPPKNHVSREEIKRGITEGVTLPSIGRTLLSKELVDEAVIISDMYNVNEYLALELLHTAQSQMVRHPGLGRGLVAVLLYYDGRRAMMTALRELAQAAAGVCWSVNVREEITTYVSRYMQQLIADGLLINILDSLQQMTLDSELAMLQSKRAIPPHKYHLTLRNAIHDTRKLMAGVVFAVSAQKGLKREIVQRLINEQTTSPSLDPTGALDEISLALQMALLYALDLSVLHSRDDGEELAKTLPLIQDPDLLASLVDQLSSPPQMNQIQDNQEKPSGVRALCQLALGLALAALKRAPQSLLRGPDGEIKCELLDQDEALVDAAIDAKVFEYIDEAMLSTDLVAKEEYYQRRLHVLITDFIVLMHSKLMEMRVKADEAARAHQMYAMEGLSAPTTRTRLHALLRCVERLYASDPTGLRHEYWRVCDHNQQNRAGGRAATLYKFVRLSGELVCASLLPAYLAAVASLAVPVHTWSLVQSRAALSAHHLLTAVRLYRSNLRSEPPAFSSSLHVAALGASAVVTPAARPGKLLVRQEEVEAMIAALKLIEAIARQDKDACVQICENPQWDSVNSMFGLICCHVPIHLKSQLCLTLAALGGSGVTAPRVWQALDAALMASDTRPLAAELMEVETRMEEYPLSRAFLHLLDSLCASAPLPRALGAGVRVPGLDPYVDHVLNKLALNAPNRPYVRAQEKWEILALCFRIFARWLDQYEPSPGDFPPFGQEAEVNPAPGFRILMQIHTKSELTRLLLDQLELACEVLTTESVSYRKHIEECLTGGLQIVERALALERALAGAAAEAGRAPLLQPLSKLVVLSDGAGGRARVAAWCAVAALTSTVPEAAARALAALCRLPPPPTLAQPAVRHAFVECLEADEWGDGEDLRHIRRAKEGVLVLVQRCLHTSTPDLALYLLGYRADDETSKSALNEPGAAGFPRTCLHSILDILEKHIENSSPDREASDLVESCYRLLYMLCSRPRTSGPLLRFLRSRDHFLPRHLKAIVHLETASVTTTSARSWVLRACACEAAAARQQLAALLQQTVSQEWEWCIIRRTLEGLRMCVRASEAPRYQLLRGGGLKRAIAECDLPSGNGGKRISVSRVHALLNRELQSVHANAPQRNLVAQEIQMVLDYVTEVNRERNLAATLTHYYDSWRQLTEIIFCVAPPDLLDIETKKNLLLNILQDLLNKIPPAEVLPQLGNLASGTVLLLLVNLRHCYILQKRESNLKSTEFETTFFGPSNQIMQTKSLTLKFILHKILSWILVAGGSTQKMRVNLYGALLNFLNIVNLKPSPADPEEEMNTTYVSRLDSSKVKPSREESSLKAMVVDVISGFGNNLSAIVCSDCIGAGHDVCRMVALSCLETLIEINPRTDWMSMLTNQGYLRSLIDSLMQDDEGLREALEPNPKSLRVLYVYESKMALLIKIASTRVGAETVLAQGALTCLANMKSMDNHPDIHTGYGNHKDTDFIPSVSNRFRQILVPALAVCDALLTSLGTQNHACVIHVLNFLMAHIECVDVILRAAHPNSPDGLLTELEALTSVIGRASNYEVVNAAHLDSSIQHGAASLQRIKSLMLALLSRWTQPSEHQLYCKIACNILTYARNISPQDRPHPALEANCGACLIQVLQRMVARAACLAAAIQVPPVLPNVSAQEMKQLLPEDQQQNVTSPSEARAALLSHLRRKCQNNVSQLSHCVYAIEAALQLLWSLARVYLRATAVESAQTLTFGTATLGGSTEDIIELRKSLVAFLNDRSIDQIIEATKSQPSSQSYLEIIIKNIKSMVQFSTV